MRSKHKKEPEIDLGWILCESLIVNLKWRARQVLKQGYVYGVKVVGPPPEETPEIVIELKRREG